MERVKIVGNHPHSGEYGTLTGEKLGGLGSRPMLYVALEDCQHGTAACYAMEANLQRKGEGDGKDRAT